MVGRCPGFLLLLLALSACDDPMAQQPGYPDPDGAAAAGFVPVPPGTVPRGVLEDRAPATPDPRRGQDRYAVYCTPCHGLAGYGDGEVTRHGYPAPPSFHAPEQQELTLATIADIIAQGKGDMPPFADRVPPADRWHIAAYVKILQFSQSVPAESLPDEDRRNLPP